MTTEELRWKVTMTAIPYMQQQFLLILILLQLLLEQPLPYFEIANQIYDTNIAQEIRNKEMNSNNLTS